MLNIRDTILLYSNKQSKLLALTTVMLMLISILAMAVSTANADSSISSWHDDPLRLNVKVAQQRSALYSDFYLNSLSSPSSSWINEFDNLTRLPKSSKYSLDSKLLNQYEATFYYPFERGNFNFDLGLNIKFINGVTEHVDNLGVVSLQKYNATLPMMYATALYELPWKGFSAGFEGKHMIYDRSSAYDYKAMFSYQADNGFGLNGGWQYQQLHLDAFQNITTDSQSEGPFVDIFFNF